MNVVTINGKTYQCEGNISVVGNKVYSDGKLLEDCENFKEKNIKIVVNGDLGILESCSADVTINGNCTSLKSSSGDVIVKGDVMENVQTVSGDVSCTEIHGDTKTVSGDIIKGGVFKNLLNKIFG